MVKCGNLLRTNVYNEGCELLVRVPVFFFVRVLRLRASNPIQRCAKLSLDFFQENFCNGLLADIGLDLNQLLHPRFVITEKQPCEVIEGQALPRDTILWPNRLRACWSLVKELLQKSAELYCYGCQVLSTGKAICGVQVQPIGIVSDVVIRDDNIGLSNGSM